MHADMPYDPFHEAGEMTEQLMARADDVVQEATEVAEESGNALWDRVTEGPLFAAQRWDLHMTHLVHRHPTQAILTALSIALLFTGLALRQDKRGRQRLAV